MFGWFSPKCPLDTYEKTWTEWRMRWLADQFGVERLLRAEVVLPTNELFAEPYRGTVEDARRLMDRLCAHLAIDPRTIELEALPDVQLPGVAGHYDRSEQTVIRVAESQLAEPLRLVATLAHELAHEKLLGGGLLDPDVADHEWVTDLLPVFFGLGLFAANATVSEQYENQGQVSWWSIGRQGYLPSRIFGYALALFAFVRGERDPSWAKHLRLDASSPLQGGLRYLRKTNDTLFHPNTARAKSMPQSSAELTVRLKTGSPTFRMAALWEIRDRPVTEPDVVAAVGLGVKDTDPAVASAACQTLAAFGPAAAPGVPHLVDALSGGCEITRVHAACALGALRQRPDVVVPELCAWLREKERDEIVEVAGALRQYGPLAEASATRILDVLRTAVIECDHGLIEALVGALLSVSPDPERLVRDHVPKRDSEMRQIVLTAIREQRALSEDQGE
jgi:hypothetical protein